MTMTCLLCTGFDRAAGSLPERAAVAIACVGFMPQPRPWSAR
jgi:hypothetical protein